MAVTERAARLVAAPGGRRTYDVYDSPLGPLLLVAEGDVLVRLELDEPTWRTSIDPAWDLDPDALSEARRELDEYFAGERRTFSVRVALSGTPFQLEVWAALTDIAYGETASYGAIAAAVGRPAAARAIGGANHVNPVPIIVPCHRVIGANGSLVGYGGGMERKIALLELEQRGHAAR